MNGKCHTEHNKADIIITHKHKHQLACSILISNSVCLENMQGYRPAFSALSILLSLKFAALILRYFSASSLAALTSVLSIVSSSFFFFFCCSFNFLAQLRFISISIVVITCGTVLLSLIIIPSYPLLMI